MCALEKCAWIKAYILICSQTCFGKRGVCVELKNVCWFFKMHIYLHGNRNLKNVNSLEFYIASEGLWDGVRKVISFFTTLQSFCSRLHWVFGQVNSF